MSLFVLASKDGWVDIMYDGLDAVGVDQQVPALHTTLSSNEVHFTFENSEAVFYLFFYYFSQFSLLVLFSCLLSDKMTADSLLV